MTTDVAQVWRVLLDAEASPTEVEQVRAVFADVAGGAEVSASYYRRGVGDYPWVIIIGAPVGTLFAAFGNTVGKGLGEDFLKWLRDLRAARRDRRGAIVLQDDGDLELILRPDIPAEAYDDLRQMIDEKRLNEIPGECSQIISPPTKTARAVQGPGERRHARGTRRHFVAGGRAPGHRPGNIVQARGDPLGAR